MMTAPPAVSIRNLRIALPKGAERPFAVDGVSSVDVTASGVTTSLSVRHNAFETTLRNVTFVDISEVNVVKESGETLRLDPAAYFPRVPRTD